ncbi:MAG: D-alanyl-D-alanine carboxypeptidase, partial [Draconibacterium sp.]|nr:D-alanyl-D-alanine carboxypeptidase [Draconibacterium sp.]
EIAEVLNHESVNLFAEHYLKHLAVVQNGLGNRNDAIEIVQNYWKKRGLTTDYFYMADGSGLSRFNAVSPGFYTNFLIKMSDNKFFLNSLPSAGEGTLDRFNESLLPGLTLQAKSGSMTRVRCYAGYLKTNSGKTLVFSFMFNHFSGSHSALIREIQKLFVLLKSEE